MLASKKKWLLICSFDLLTFEPKNLTMKLTKYYVAAFSAFLIWGFFSLALKPLQDYPSLDILFFRVFISAVLMLLVNLIFRKAVLQQQWKLFRSLDSKQQRQTLFYTFSGSLLLAANWFVFIYVVNHIGVKTASLAYLICPILTSLLAFVLIKETLNKWQWVAISISTIGCYILSMHHFGDILYSIVVAATYSFYLISQRKNSFLDKFILLSIQIITLSVILLPFYPMVVSDVPRQETFYTCLFFITVFFTIIPLFLNQYALKALSSSTVGIMMYINPIINFSLAFLYFKETVSTLHVIAYLLIVVSIVVFNYKIIFIKKNL
ncbi:EamA family transporter [Flavobacterium branchiophilum]